MVAEHLIVTGYVSGSVKEAALDPSDILTVGLSSDGYLTVDATAWNQEGILFRLYSGNSNGSESAYLGDYYFDNNVKTKLSDAFPGIELHGCYLRSDTFMGPGDDPIPIRAPYTACTWDADASCSLSATLSSGDVTLSWSGAKAGTENAITGYDVQYCESSDGLSWGSWTAPETVISTATSGSTSVSPSSTYGNYRKFRVRTQGAAGSDYYSDWLESANVLRRDHAMLSGFTDATLTAGTSPVKALHMTELQDRVNTLRTFYGLSAYSFTTITAGTTNLAGWTTHVNQIRAAIEDVCNASGKTHESWISFSVNCPRADVIQQLRSVILAL